MTDTITTYRNDSEDMTVTLSLDEHGAYHVELFAGSVRKWWTATGDAEWAGSLAHGTALVAGATEVLPACACSQQNRAAGIECPRHSDAPKQMTSPLRAVDRCASGLRATGTLDDLSPAGRIVLDAARRYGYIRPSRTAPRFMLRSLARRGWLTLDMQGYVIAGATITPAGRKRLERAS